jgi:hypothetical protein
LVARNHEGSKPLSKMIDGKPISNASMALRLNVTAEDIRDGAPLNPYACGTR